MKAFSKSTLLVIILLFTISPVSAQYTLFEHPVGQKYFEVFVSKPILEEDDFYEYDAVSNIGILSSQFYCSSSNCFVAEVPYAYASIPSKDSSDDFYNNSDKFIIGNPLLGVRKKMSDMQTLDFSLTLPNVSANNGFISPFYGLIARMDQMEMFAPELTTLSIDSLFTFSRNSNVQPFIKIGLIGWKRDIPSSEEGDEFEVLNRYEIGFNVNQSEVMMSTKIKGITIITESDIDFSERNLNYFTLALKHKSAYQPGIHVMMPLDDEFEMLKYTIGVSIASSF